MSTKKNSTKFDEQKTGNCFFKVKDYNIYLADRKWSYTKHTRKHTHACTHTYIPTNGCFLF